MSKEPHANPPEGADENGVATERPEADEAEDNRRGKAREIGGRDGPDPTRYGDWEKNGRCIDF